MPITTTDAWSLYNDNAELLVTNEAAQDFIQAISDEHDKGMGFVPFIGAGLSAPSGIPLIWELKSYLCRCIGLALGVEESGMTPWNPRTDQWPPFNDPNRAEITDWLSRVQAEFESRRRLNQWDSEVAVFQEAIGAMAEWRTALLFLSRLVHDVQKRGWDTGIAIALDAPEQAVIDACIREVMRGKQPTLGHRMLATLAGLLRLNIIVTTNFDDLLERAFGTARNPLTAFNVELNGQLPAASDISNNRSIVKLHGTGHSLRADYTLDALPSEQDRWRFLEYLLSDEARTQLPERLRIGEKLQDLKSQNHLLVMGFSANERRTRTFIEHACNRLNAQFKVFWLCHTATDVAKVKAFSNEINEQRKKEPRKKRSPTSVPQFHILRHTNLGLLFLEMFQTMRRSLPPTGIVFPSLSRLAIPPMPSCTNNREKLLNGRNLQSDILSRIARFEEPGYAFHKLIVITSAPEVRGVMSVCAGVYDGLADNHVCLWFDMNDVSSGSDLFEKLLDAAYFRLGRESWMPVHVTDDPRKRAEEIHRLAQITTNRWIIFLNARETPGANVKEPQTILNDVAHPNQWIDDDTFPSLANTKASGSTKQNTPMMDFIALLTELCGSLSSKISVVLLCHSYRDEKKKLRIPVLERLCSLRIVDDAIYLEKAAVEFDEDEVIIHTLSWLNAGPDRKAKRQFLQAFILLQRTRYLATFWSDATWLSQLQPAGSKPIDLPTARIWLADLEAIGLLRRKSGGFIWIHSLTRTRLRLLIGGDSKSRNAFFDKMPKSIKRSTGYAAAVASTFEDWNPQEDEWIIQEKLADWYISTLMPSESPAALFEAVYHTCRSAKASLLLEPKNKAVENAVRQLNRAAAELNTFSFMAQTIGYSRGSCRQLDFLSVQCDEIEGIVTTFPKTKPSDKEVQRRLLQATKMLRIRCAELMRAIGREVGELPRAYQRHRELLGHLTNNQVTNSRGRTKKLFESLFRGSHADTGIDPPREWLRWCRWSSMLAIESRSYHKAYNSIHRGLSSIVYSSNAGLDRLLFPENDNANITKIVSLVGGQDSILPLLGGERVSVCGVETANSQQVRLEVVRLLEQVVSAGTLEFSVRRRLHKRIDITSVEHLFQAVGIAMQIVRSILNSDKRGGGQDIELAKWCESRLHMHVGMLCVYSAEKDRHGVTQRCQDAMKSLIKAEDCLSLMDPRRRGTDLGLIELFRAEVRLREADSVTVKLAGKECSFKDYRSTIIKWWRNAVKDRNSQPWRSLRKDLVDQFEGTTEHNGLQAARALVDDARRFLERAETMLQSRRKNVWWSTWLFERNLIVIQMSVWASLPDQNATIPFLGLDCAPRRTETLADKMLSDALRMVRLDAYRLASIVRAYSDCALGLRLRLMSDWRVNRMPQRQESMAANLQRAVRRLKDVFVERLDKRESIDYLDLHKDVEKYVSETVTDTEELSRLLEDPIV